MNLHYTLQDPAGIFELIEVVGNGTYGQVYKVNEFLFLLLGYFLICPARTSRRDLFLGFSILTCRWVLLRLR